MSVSELDSKPQLSIQDTINDSLPIVELRPFSKHVWRRERSLPEFYNQPPEISQGGEGCYFPDECLPSIVEVLADITQSSYQHKSDRSKRFRSNLHPKKPTTNVSTSGKTSGIIAGFITKEDRTKSTLFMSGQDENPKSYSCRKQALNSATVRRQQQLQLNGGPLCHPDNMPNTFVYLNRLLHYKQKASLRQMIYPQTYPSIAPSDDRVAQFTSLPGKELDIISAVRKGSTKPRLRPISSGKRFNGTKDVFIEKASVTSNWDPRNYTKPTIIERHLDRDKSFHRDHYRRTMDIGYSSLDILDHLQTEHALSRSLTHGELFIRRGKNANRRKSRISRETKVLAPVVEPNMKRSSILSIRKCGPELVVAPTRNMALTAVLIAEEVRGDKTCLEKETKCSDISMPSDNSDRDIQSQNEGNASACKSESSGECDVIKLNHTVLVPMNRLTDDHKYMDHGSAEISSPMKDSMGMSNLENTPLIELVAEANSNQIGAMLTSTSGCTESAIDIYTRGNSTEHQECEMGRGPHDNNLYDNNQIKRRPRACAYDDKDCNTHKVNNKNDNVIDNKNNRNSGAHNQNYKNIEKNSSDNKNRDVTIANNPKKSNAKTRNNDILRENKKNSDTNGDSEKHSDNNNTIGIIDNINNFNNRAATKNKVGVIDSDDPLKHTKDQHTHLDSCDNVDGNGIDDPLLQSTTFLTTNV